MYKWLYSRTTRISRYYPYKWKDPHRHTQNVFLNGAKSKSNLSFSHFRVFNFKSAWCIVCISRTPTTMIPTIYFHKKKHKMLWVVPLRRRRKKIIYDDEKWQKNLCAYDDHMCVVNKFSLNMWFIRVCQIFYWILSIKTRVSTMYMEGIHLTVLRRSDFFFVVAAEAIK